MVFGFSKRKIKFIKGFLMDNETFQLKIRLNNKYKKIFEQFEISDISISKLMNELLKEVENNKSFKFMIMKRILKDK